VKGFRWSIKRVYRIYCELPNMRIKPKKRLKRDKPEPLAKAGIQQRMLVNEFHA
jgi:putative transposase